MLLNPFELAAAVAQVAGRTLPGLTQSQFAWALAKHNGVALDRESNMGYVVLGDPLAGEDQLTLVAGALPTTLKARKARDCARLQGAFHLACGNIDPGAPPGRGVWLPTLLGNDAYASVGGQLPQPTHRAHKSFGVHWYPLDDFVVGDVFCIMTHRTDQLAVYQRLDRNYFALLQVPSARNMVNMSDVMTAMGVDKAKVEGIEATTGELVLLRDPPRHNPC